jgi:hypothetical protein
MPGLVGNVARVAVASGTATAVRNRVSRRQAERWSEQGASQPAYLQPQQAAAPPPQAAPAPAESDYTAELEKLAKLRDEGVITADDFEAKKKQLLGI